MCLAYPAGCSIFDSSLKEGSFDLSQFKERCNAVPHCFNWLRHTATFALRRAFSREGNKIESSIPIMATTIRSSISVNFFIFKYKPFDIIFLR